MYAYTAETGHTMNFGHAVVSTYAPDDLAREMARRSFTAAGEGTAPEQRAAYTSTEHAPAATGALRITVTNATGAETLTIFIGTREQIDALSW